MWYKVIKVASANSTQQLLSGVEAAPPLTCDSADDPTSKMKIDQSSTAQFSVPWLLPSSETTHRITERPKGMQPHH